MEIPAGALPPSGEPLPGAQRPTPGPALQDVRQPRPAAGPAEAERASLGARAGREKAF
jgi:hypothetical protein